MAKISKMSHEERLRQQKEILSSLTPEQIELIKSLRKAKENARKEEAPMELPEESPPHSELSRKQESQSMECEESGLDHLVDAGSYVASPGTKKEVRFSDDVEMKEVPPKDDAENIEKMGIPIPLKDAKKWINMTKVSFLNDDNSFVAVFDYLFLSSVTLVEEILYLNRCKVSVFVSF